MPFFFGSVSRVDLSPVEKRQRGCSGLAPSFSNCKIHSSIVQALVVIRSTNEKLKDDWGGCNAVVKL
jgi:hypothetical protein